MQGKFRFSLDGVDATARQFTEVRRQLHELSSTVGVGVSGVAERVSAVEDGFTSLTSDSDSADIGGGGSVIVPSHGGTGVRNVSDSLLSLAPRKPVYCLRDGVLGCDCSSASSVANVSDADGFVPLDALRRLRWKVYFLKDDLNLNLDAAQPVVGLVAEDLDDAGLGFFCEYDGEGNPTGVDYSRLSVAVLRLAQEAMDEVDGLKAEAEGFRSEVDGLKAEVERLSAVVGKMGVSTSNN